MSRSWRKLAAPTLLVLALVGVLGPALTVLSASRACAELAADAAPERAEAPCQWLAPASCCAEMTSATPPPSFAPPPAASWLATLDPTARESLRPPLAPAAPRADRLAHATIVLLL